MNGPQGQEYLLELIRLKVRISGSVTTSQSLPSLPSLPTTDYAAPHER